MKLEFSQQIFEKIPPIPNFMKIRTEEAELFHADRQADGRTDGQNEVNSRFLQFCESVLTKTKSTLCGDCGHQHVNSYTLRHIVTKLSTRVLLKSPPISASFVKIGYT
jgi:hypothetical protein